MEKSSKFVGFLGIKIVQNAFQQFPIMKTDDDNQNTAMPVRNGTLTKNHYWNEGSLSEEKITWKCGQTLF